MAPQRARICCLIIVLVGLAGCVPGGPRTATAVDPKVVADVPMVSPDDAPTELRELTPARPLFGQMTEVPRPTPSRTPTSTPTQASPPTPTPDGWMPPTPVPTRTFDYPVPTAPPTCTPLPYHLLHPDTPTPSITPTRPTPFPRPDLRSWEAPPQSPTPMAAIAEIARGYLARHADIAPESIRLERWVEPTHPETGERVWVGEFEALGKREIAYVAEDGTVGLAPGLADVCLAMAADEKGCALDELQVISARHRFYAFSQQVVFECMIHGPDMWIGELALDWWGNRLAWHEVNAAEKTAQATACPKMYGSLCDAIRQSPGATHNVVVYLPEGADLDMLLARAQRDDPEAFIHGTWLHARLTSDQIVALSVEPSVSGMDIDSERRHLLEDKPLSALDRNLRFDLAVKGDAVFLELWTFPDYGCCNYELIADVSQPLDQQLRVEVQGVYKPHICLTAMGPARAALDLGELQGRWRLNIAYPRMELNDEYILDVGEETIRLEQRHATFTWAAHGAWPRAAE